MDGVLPRGRSAQALLLRSKQARKFQARIQSVYDMSAACNLRCEGCVFYNTDGTFKGDAEGSFDRSDQRVGPELDEYEALFKSEVARGVSLPIFSGAEPALRQDILRIATSHWKDGIIFTNGTIPIDPKIRYRQIVSVWGHRENTDKWRGAKCYDRSLRTIHNDDRVIVLYVVSRANIEDIPAVMEDVVAANLPFHFQIYSPTNEYTDFLNLPNDTQRPFAKHGNVEDNLDLRPEDNQRAIEVLIAMKHRYPDTILASDDFIRWCFNRPKAFDFDPASEKFPKRCHQANDANRVHYLYDLSAEESPSCGHSNVDCNKCRTLSSLMYGYADKKYSSLSNVSAAERFIEFGDFVRKVYTPQWQWNDADA